MVGQESDWYQNQSQVNQAAYDQFQLAQEFVVPSLFLCSFDICCQQHLYQYERDRQYPFQVFLPIDIRWHEMDKQVAAEFYESCYKFRPFF